MRVVPTVVAVVLATTFAVAQEKQTRTGITNYTKVDAVVACGGATETSALDGLKADGFKSVINLRLATENGANIDFMNANGEIARQHYAFLVSDSDFDEIFGRIRERALPYWADPARSQQGEINHHDGGRGVYFEDPNGHLLEVITRSYGSGGWNP